MNSFRGRFFLVSIFGGFDGVLCPTDLLQLERLESGMHGYQKTKTMRGVLLYITEHATRCQKPDPDLDSIFKTNAIIFSSAAESFATKDTSLFVPLWNIVFGDRHCDWDS